MAVPKFYEFFMPVLRALRDGQTLHVRDIRQSCIRDMSMSKETLEERLPSQRQATVENRINWAITYLKKAGLLCSTSRGYCRITPQGVQVLNSGDVVDLRYLRRFPAFVEFLGAHMKPQVDTPSSEPDTPVETLEEAYLSICRTLADEVMDAVMQASPRFFEHLVVDLLQRIGYGGAFDGDGIVTQQSADGGIDGVIREDKLGFNSIYVQAKRWQPDQTVGRPEIQKFAGALLGQGASKGVFITTAHFSVEAKKYADSISTANSRIVLIDGDQLAQLMITYNVGVSVHHVYEMKKIDSDYFSDDL